MTPSITPRLVVRGADAALRFYSTVLNAQVEERYALPDGHVVHAALRVGDQHIALTEQRPEWHNLSPSELGGSPVILNIVVDDVDAVTERFLQGGAEIIFPVADQFYGHREGRVRDPFGHVWIVTTIIERLTSSEIAARMR